MTVGGAAFAQGGVIATQCAEDIERYCPDMSHMGGAIQLCLGEHMEQVTATCRNAIESTERANRRFGWGGAGRRPTYMGLRQIVATVQNLGYTGIREIDFEGGHYEIEAMDSTGREVEILVDAVTGKVLRSKVDD